MNNILLICNYFEGRTGHLEKCLSSIQRMKTENTIVGIIDNGSKDNSYIVINTFIENKTIDFAIFNRINVGKAKALNSLLKYINSIYQISTEDLIYSIDSDIEFTRDDTIVKFEKLFKENDDISLISVIYNNENNEIDLKYNLYDKDDILSFDNEEYFINKSGQHIGGALFVIPVNDFLHVGMYNENIGKDKMPAIYGGDDAVLLLKLFKSFPNKKQMVCKTISIIHPSPIDNDYQQWKEKQNKLMCTNGFGNNNLDDKGFYDK